MHDFKDITDGEYVNKGNSTTTRAMGQEKILLKYTSSKLLSLSNVLYVPSLHRNLVFGIRLKKDELKTIVGHDKVVIFHNGVFIRKRYQN